MRYRTRWRISLDTGGRPGFLRRDFHVQKSLNPLRCQPMTVSGLTITRAWRQPGHRQDRMTQKTLSAFRSDGRGLFRFRTATCCRRARISVWSAARSAKISMILCMPERVSGGDAKFQGFCDRWNKWEGRRRNEQFTIYAILVHHNALCCCYNCIYFSSVEFRHHIVTGFDLHPDATCRVRRRHLPLFSNRIQSSVLP